jgi:hypothetical protein
VAVKKLEIKKQFGRFERRFYDIGKSAPKFRGEFPDIDSVWDDVVQSLPKAGISSANSVVFRGINYESEDDLRIAVRSAPY